MKIGLVGSGGREHSIAKALTRYRERDSLYVYAGHLNPGIEALSQQTLLGSLDDITTTVNYFVEVEVDYVVIGPEVPLLAGAVDALRAAGIPAVGPTRSQARIEGDKSFMRNLLRKRVGWGSPAWRLVSERQEAEDFIFQTGEVVVKPLGLTGGKGVQVMGVHLGTLDDTLDVIDSWIDQDGSVLLEERLVGEEFSRMAFISDDVIVPMPLCQDFKYAYDGDQGGMTGGMGAYTYADGSMPFIEPRDLINADRLMAETINALVAETGGSYRGFLYGQFMATSNGIRVIEYNARLGDPEAINVMILLEGDPASLMYQVSLGELDPSQVRFNPQASLCKYLVPSGYPDNPGEPLTFSLDKHEIAGADFSIIYASVQREGDEFLTLGSRTLALAGVGDSPGEISRRSEALLAAVEPHGLRHRRDVGDEEVIQKKIERLHRLRGGGSGKK